MALQVGWLEKTVSRLFKPLVSAVVRDEDSDADRKMKVTMVPVSAVYWVMYLTFIIFQVVTASWANIPVQGVTIITTGVYLVYVFRTKRSPVLYSEILIFISFFAVLVTDAQTRGGYDMWIAAIIIGDICLLGGFRPLVGSSVRNILVVYLAVKSFEEVYQFGLYDIPSDTTVARRVSESQSVGVQTFVLRTLFYISDYGMTHYFAASMSLRQQEVKESVQLAEEVAHSFVRFDLEKAEGLLDAYRDAGNDNELLVPFRELLQNLKHYRPYLPQHLLTHESSGSLIVEVAAVSSCEAPREHAAIVFTDIQNSTSLWEAVPHAMRHALAIHNRTMRETIAACSGYEVKTIGDAFMVAFKTAEQAVEFCLQAQLALVNQKYHKDLTALADCAQVQDKETTLTYLWNGLRVRMGVHIGDVDAEQNPITNRYDYFGSTVNKAARVEGSSVGGAIAVTNEVMSSLQKDGGFHSESMGAIALKGVAEKSGVHLVFPSSLKNRKPEVLASWRSRHVDAMLNSPAQRRSAIINPLGARTAMELSRATVACVDITFRFLDEDGAYGVSNRVVCALLEGVERTLGTVSSVTGLGLTAMWNVGRACPQHTAMALRFANIVQPQLSGGCEETHGHVGVCSGKMLHGSVGTDRTKFIVAIGSCMNLASALSRVGREAGAFALLGEEEDLRVTEDPAVRRTTRIIDEWLLETGWVYVYEVKPESEAPWCLDDELWGSDKYAANVHHAMKGDKEAVAELAKLVQPRDRVAMKLLTRLEERGHLTHGLPMQTSGAETGLTSLRQILPLTELTELPGSVAEGT